MSISITNKVWHQFLPKRKRSRIRRIVPLLSFHSKRFSKEFRMRFPEGLNLQSLRFQLYIPQSMNRQFKDFKSESLFIDKLLNNFFGIRPINYRLTMEVEQQLLKTVKWVREYLFRFYINTIKKIYIYDLCRQYRSTKIHLKSLVSKHPYHLVNVSPWPIFIAFCLFGLTIGSVLFFHNFDGDKFLGLLSICALLLIISLWFRDILRESVFEGYHTLDVQRGLMLGMLLFILSEVMFSVSFFRGFFHSSLSPAIQIGGIWPPLGIETFNPWDIPLLNTVILLTSGATVTWVHYKIRTSLLRRTSQNALFAYGVVQSEYPLMVIPYDRLDKHRLKLYSHRDCMWSIMQCDGRFIARKVNFYLRYVWFLKIVRSHDIYYSYIYNYIINLLAINVTFIRRRHPFLNAIEILRVIGYPLNLMAFRFKRKIMARCNTERQDLIFGFIVTISLGILFTIIQYFEYLHANFTIADSIYGTTFFLTTGFHGLHVLVGTIFLSVCLRRAINHQFTKTHHIGLESAIWYWHFVDVVWLGLYIAIYHWGSDPINSTFFSS